VPQLKPPPNAIKPRRQSVNLALDGSQVAQHEADCASIRGAHLPAY
jgi:hypothetical protein